MNVSMGCTRNCFRRQALKRTFSTTAIPPPQSDVGLREGSLAPRIHGQSTLGVIVDQVKPWQV